MAIEIVQRGLAVIEEARAIIDSMVSWLGSRLSGRCQ
jgi:hypothetical protein